MSNKYVNSWQEALVFVKAELAKHKDLTRDIEMQIIRKTQKKFGFSEEAVAGLMHDAMQQSDIEEVLSIIKGLKERNEHATWRMIYRRFPDFDAYNFAVKVDKVEVYEKLVASGDIQFASDGEISGIRIPE